ANMVGVRCRVGNCNRPAPRMPRDDRPLEAFDLGAQQLCERSKVVVVRAVEKRRAAEPRPVDAEHLVAVGTEPLRDLAEVLRRRIRPERVPEDKWGSSGDAPAANVHRATPRRSRPIASMRSSIPERSSRTWLVRGMRLAFLIRSSS